MKLAPIAATAVTSLAASSTVAPQQAVASSGLNVRTSRSTSAAVVGHIEDGDTVTLLATKATQGYFHARTKDSTIGWAWAARPHVGGGGTTGAAVCAAVGEGSGSHYDQTTNRWKNRSNSSAHYIRTGRSPISRRRRRAATPCGSVGR